MISEKTKQQLWHFRNHKATLEDYGKIKVLDYKAPDTIEYHVRFLFDEPSYTVHITGDLGTLTASNYCNMTLEGFSQFIGDPDYFMSKVDCHDRPFYVYDEDEAKKQLLELYGKDRLAEALDLDDFEREECFDYNLDDLFADFDQSTGAGQELREVMDELCGGYCEVEADMLGRQDTGIVELYLTAFTLAMKDLRERGES